MKASVEKASSSFSLLCDLIFGGLFYFILFAIWIINYGEATYLLYDF